MCGLHKTIPACHPHVSGGFQGCNIQSIAHECLQDHLRSSLMRVDQRDFKPSAPCWLVESCTQKLWQMRLESISLPITQTADV